ncbi:MAG: CbtA family protein [Haloferacaceae archaeon]
MFAAYVVRGAGAGLAAGTAFAAFVALVGNPLVAAAEAAAGGHGAAPAVPSGVTSAVGVAAGVGLGLLFGVCFGVAYFLLEPSLPGGAGARSALLGAAGFVTVSGAPWLVLPPRPAGVEAALPAGVRVAWYAGMMVLGALACGLAGAAYARVGRRRGRPAALAAAALPLALLLVPAALAPTVPATGAVPDPLAAAFRGAVVVGQVGLWATLAGTHAWLCRRGASTPAPVPASAD